MSCTLPDVCMCVWSLTHLCCRYGSILKEIEGVAAASTHPGDWRYRNFDYE
jgi:hypothetical protein